MTHNEDSRVKIPAILHLCQLGYQYLPLRNANWNPETNIFPDLFQEAIGRLNPDLNETEISRLLQEISLELDNEDLGQAFYKRLVAKSGVRLIDFEESDNNSFHVVTELPCKKDREEFRPDITLLINGMPLAFIEVKKPNNRDGVLAERDRMATRFQNRKFRKFLNITQLMVFSNNMEYDDDDIHPVQGAFYATTAFRKPVFNYFREEETLDLTQLLQEDEPGIVDTVLKDNNLEVVKSSPEFQTNRDPNSPTNRILTSLFSKVRFSFLLNYAFAYVKEANGLQKHIMRYPQLFGVKAIEKELEEGTKSGIIWHTQGSGKTALAFYSVKFLTHYFQKQGVIPKFYFIVDRLDLLTQASREFKMRGLIVHTVLSKEDFVNDIKTTTGIHNQSGKPEITLVNIQKFSDDAEVVHSTDYSVNIQRIYFLDEVHRSYNPQGSFLANLEQSDRNAIKIGLTGTPLISTDYYSRDLFGKYIHKYYYNASIADGYTLRLIREGIETSYRLRLDEILREIEILSSELNKREIYAHKRFVEPLLDYIIDDFTTSRINYGDESIGAMVICDSSDQARQMYETFQKLNAPAGSATAFSHAAEDRPAYGKPKNNYTAALILHDNGTKDDRDRWVEEYKAGKIDFLFVYNMLLTGFDAPRLKKLYIGRLIKRHNLLQALTRVNRTYREFRYGYVVDFADIREEFKATNDLYFKELKNELGDEMQHYSDLFKTKEEIEAEIEEIKECLFHYDIRNAETFSQQISDITDLKEMQTLVKVLKNTRSLYNLIRLQGNYELLQQLDFRKVNILYRQAADHLALLHTKHALEHETDTTNLLNIALEEVVFNFLKVSESELIIADQLRSQLRQTREEFNRNFDQKDPEFVSLYAELQRLFRQNKLNEVAQEAMQENIAALRQMQDNMRELNRRNNLLKAKYEQDAKYARIHKRLRERETQLTEKETKLLTALRSVKNLADDTVLQNQALLQNEGYFEKMVNRLVVAQFKTEHKIPLDATAAKDIGLLVTKEYLNEFHGRTL